MSGGRVRNVDSLAHCGTAQSEFQAAAHGSAFVGVCWAEAHMEVT
jgi:hypothetical protein